MFSLMLHTTAVYHIENYSRVLLSHGAIWHQIAFRTAVIGTEHESDFELTKDTP